MTSIPPTRGPGRIEVVLTEAGLVALLRRLEHYELSEPLDSRSRLIGVKHDAGRRVVSLILQHESCIQNAGEDPRRIFARVEGGE